MTHLSRVEDLSKEESLSFATQVQQWFRAVRGSFPEKARQVLADKGSG